MNPWVVGWVASDGHNAGAYWVISQNIDDVDALILIKEIYPDVRTSVSFSTDNRYGDKPMVRIVRKSKEDCMELITHGIPIGNKTTTLSFPVGASDDFLWQYLRGFFEGDGSLSMERNRYPRFGITSSLIWCESCKKWLSKFGISCYVSKDGENAFCLNVHTIKGVRTLIEKMYHTNRDRRMGRKFSVAMKVITMLDYWENKKNKCSINRANNKSISIELNNGLSIDAITKKLNCSIHSVVKIRKSLGLQGHRANVSIEEIQKELKNSDSRESVVKLGYGRKIVNKAFKLLYGDPAILREKRNADIRKLILDGCFVSDIVDRMKCGEAKVIKEKRYLYSLGYKIKLNKVKGMEVHSEHYGL